MRDIRMPRSPLRHVVLGLLALGLVMLPDAVFSAPTESPWEVTVLRMLGLVGLAVIAGLPWLRRATAEARRRQRMWSIPGLASFTIYLLSTDPLFLVVGFCLLTGAAVDMWMTRAHVAAESVRIRLMANESDIELD